MDANHAKLLLLAGRLSRRRLLALSALSAAPWALAACGVGSAPHAVHSASPTPTPTTPPPLTDADWRSFGATLQGSLVRPGDAEYATARQLFHPHFDAFAPQGIAYCATPTDAQTCLAFARRFALPFSVRSGGHSYAGYSTSTGLVLDVSRMNSVQVNASAGTAVVGAGARLIDVYATLAAQGQALPAGSCPSVGIAGLALGGGVGVLARKYGLTCDNLLAAQIVLADGRLLTCDANHEPDLFWALRGGGGGNFGVVTSFTFQTHATPNLTLFTLNWPWSSAAEMLAAWQAWAPGAPDELWSNCLLLCAADTRSEPIARVNGVYVGEEAPLQALLQRLTRQISAAPLSSFVGPDDLLDAMLIEAGCYGKTVAECHLPSQNPQGQVARADDSSRSDYCSSPLPTAGISKLVSAITARSAQAANSGGIGMDAMGGVINRIASDATAFVHRQELFSIQYSASFSANATLNDLASAQNWLDQLWEGMRPYVSGDAYQNYIDPNLPDWLQAYYGANLPRLMQVKARYDPTDVFHFAQSIPLPG